MGSLMSRVLQATYAGFIITSMVCAAAQMKIVTILPLSKGTREGICLMIIQAAWRVASFFTPWIQLAAAPDFEAQCADLASAMAAVDARAAASEDTWKPLLILGNHTSFFDTLLFVQTAPSSVLWRVRTYMAAHLYKLPILSTIARSVGHFPVHFQSSEDGSFKVDAERMEKVEEQVDEHLRTGGWLCFYPEGQINKNPDELLPFRFGGMKKALAFDARLVTFVGYGCPSVWPRGALGGLPGTVTYGFKALAPNGCRALVAEVRAKAGVGEKDERPDHEVLAVAARTAMEQHLAELKKQAASSTGAVLFAWAAPVAISFAACATVWRAVTGRLQR